MYPVPFSFFGDMALGSPVLGWVGTPGPNGSFTRQIRMTLSDQGTSSFTLGQQGSGEGASIVWDQQGGDNYFIGNTDAGSANNAPTDQVQSGKTGLSSFTLHQQGVVSNGQFVVQSFNRDEQGSDGTRESIQGNYAAGVLAIFGLQMNGSASTQHAYHWQQQGTPASSLFTLTNDDISNGTLVLDKTDGTFAANQTQRYNSTFNTTKTGTAQGSQATVTATTVSQNSSSTRTYHATDTNAADSFTKDEFSQLTTQLTANGRDTDNLNSFSYGETSVDSMMRTEVGGDANGSFSQNEQRSHTTGLQEQGSVLLTFLSLNSFTRDDNSSSSLGQQQTQSGNGTSSRTTSSNRQSAGLHGSGSLSGGTVSLDSFVKDQGNQMLRVQSVSNSDGSNGTSNSDTGQNSHAEGTAAPVPQTTNSWTISNWSQTDAAGTTTTGGSNQSSTSQTDITPDVGALPKPLDALNSLKDRAQPNLLGTGSSPALGGVAGANLQADPGRALGGNPMDAVSARLLGAAESQQISSGQTDPNSQLLNGQAGPAGIDPSKPAAAAAQAVARLATNVQNLLRTLSGRVVGGMNLHELGLAAMNDGMQAWQGLHGKVAEGLALPQTTDARIAALTREVPPSFAPTMPPPPLLSKDLLVDITNLFSAWADKLTLGLTQKLRAGLGYDDAVDKNSQLYQLGSSIGDLHANLLLLGGGGATGWAAVALQGLRVADMAGGVIQAVEAAQAGDVGGIFQALLQVGLRSLMGVNKCGLGFLAKTGLTALQGIQTVQLADQAFGKLASGDTFGGLVDLFNAGVSLRLMLQACFVAGTPILTREGDKPIEKLEAWRDWVLARAEDDPNGPVVPKLVTGVFVRVSAILNLHVGGQLIRTTPEHPFWVKGKGWRPTADLQPGDLLSSHDGRWKPVEAVTDSGEVTTVFNVEVDQYHTYFVGSQAWGFSIWAHNSKCVEIEKSRGKTTLKIRNKFRAGTYESRQLQRFTKAWNEQIGKAGGSMTRRSPTAAENQASNAWKKQMIHNRKRGQGTFTLQWSVNVPCPLFLLAIVGKSEILSCLGISSEEKANCRPFVGGEVIVR